MWHKASLQTIQIELIPANEHIAYERYSSFPTNPVLPNILAICFLNNASWYEF